MMSLFQVSYSIQIFLILKNFWRCSSKIGNSCEANISMKNGCLNTQISIFKLALTKSVLCLYIPLSPPIHPRES